MICSVELDRIACRLDSNSNGTLAWRRGMGEGHSESSPVVAAGLPAERVATLRLAMLPGIGPRTLTALIERFGDAKAVLAAAGSQLSEVRGVGPKLIHSIRTASHHVDVEGIENWCRTHRCQPVFRDDERYPSNLSDLVDAPPVLFAQGDLLERDQLAVAIVGTRHPTAYGLQQAERFGFALAQAGVTVVSGLARGIDGAAHEGALNAGGRTIAILGSGLANIYPSEHQPLAHRIAASGAALSEFSPHAKPRSGMFPQRNRLIAALSLATLVIEAPDRSGALITARLAGEQNRDVFALPGPVTSRASRGCNQLVRDGATLVQTADDVLESLGPIASPVATANGRQVRNPAELTLNEVEQTVVNAIEESSTLIDQVIERSGLPAQQVIATISVLEMRKLVRRLSGQYVSRV